MQRIFAGIAGGKRYFYGDDGELYDEAGIKQDSKYAALLKAQFTKPNTPRPQQPPSNPSNSPRKPKQTEYEEYDHDNDPSTPPRLRPVRDFAKTVAKQAGEDALRAAFPEVYNAFKKYRKVFKSGDTKKSKKDKGKKASDKKRNDKELSLKIDTIASNVRSNGELLRQQLTLQERGLEFLEKISQGVKGGKKDPADVGKGGILSKLKSWLLPALGITAVAGLGATALWAYNNKEDTPAANDGEDDRDTGTVTADENVPGASTIPSEGVTNAEGRKPSTSRKDLEIKGDSLTFQSKIIKLDARTITIGGDNRQSGAYGATGNEADANGPPTLSEWNKQRTAPGNVDPFGDSQIQSLTPSATPDGRSPAGSVFKPDITTPDAGGVTGGKGAFSGFGGGQVLNPKEKDTAEQIRKGDLSTAQQFTPQPKGAEGGQTLSEQRADFKKQLDADPGLREEMAALVLAEEGGDSNARKAVAETMLNRSNSTGRTDISKTIRDKRYYQPYQNGQYDDALARLRANPDLAKQVHKDIDAALNGSNVSNLATDNASANVKANALNRGDTMTYEGKNGEGFFRKDQNADYHGKRRVEQDRDWAAKTQAAMKREAEQKAAATQPGKMPRVPNSFIGGEVNQGDLGAMFNKAPISDQFQPGFNMNPVLQPEGPAHSEAEAIAKGLPMRTDRIGRLQGSVTEPAKAGVDIMETTKEVPGEIPESSLDKFSSPMGDQFGANDDTPEKTDGNKTKLTDNSGGRAPKQIRKVDLNKYYPQYPKSDYGEQTGISVV